MEVHMTKTKTRNPGRTVRAEACEPLRSVARHPREGSKQALVLLLLSRPEGATLPDLIEATGWLPHTTRAALTSLRKRGFAIDRATAEGGQSTYRIAAPEPEPDPKAKRRSGRQRPAEKVEADAVA